MSDEIDFHMREIIRHHVEYGCKRPDKIEFTAPHDNWIRCGAGCEPQYKYTAPSRCNLCEETGMTKAGLRISNLIRDPRTAMPSGARISESDFLIERFEDHEIRKP